jgi:plastocyanin
MRRTLPILCCMVTVAAFAATSEAANRASSGHRAAAKHHAPTNLLIDAQEWSLWPSRPAVPAGTVYVELWNRGQDAHDTWIRRLNAQGQMVGRVLDKVRLTLPGKVSQATWHLKPGRYELFCSLPGHLALGMHGNLTVTRT